MKKSNENPLANFSGDLQKSIYKKNYDKLKTETNCISLTKDMKEPRKTKFVEKIIDKIIGENHGNIKKNVDGKNGKRDGRKYTPNTWE
tara:strand:- start:483 stop:746 length:264 start_codon:yes stop_codon:yes gene_type:complete